MVIAERVEELWRELHSMPEPGFKEFKTAAFLAAALQAAGYQVRKGVGGTGVIGVLDSAKCGPIVGLRADMDCLLFTQEDGSSKAIHACGHDGNMAMTLTAAEALADSGISRGRVVIVFQPSEENGAGAKALLATGLLDELEYLFACHLLGKDILPSGTLTPAVLWSASNFLEVEVEGRASHAANPQLSISAVDVGTAMVNAVNALHTNPLYCGSVKATRFMAGEGMPNIIAGKAMLNFDLRSASNVEIKALTEQVTKLLVTTAEAYGAQASVRSIGSNPAAEYDAKLVALAQDTIVEELGRGALVSPRAITVGEDFNYYTQLLPSLHATYLGLGCDLEPGLHAPDMHFKHEDLANGAKVLYRLLQKLTQA